MASPFFLSSSPPSGDLGGFPADFISEGVDQTRGWFFTLHAISTMVRGSVAFKNVISNGLVLAIDNIAPVTGEQRDFSLGIIGASEEGLVVSRGFGI